MWITDPENLASDKRMSNNFECEQNINNKGSVVSQKSQSVLGTEYIYCV